MLIHMWLFWVSDDILFHFCYSWNSCVATMLRTAQEEGATNQRKVLEYIGKKRFDLSCSNRLTFFRLAPSWALWESESWTKQMKKKNIKAARGWLVPLAGYSFAFCTNNGVYFRFWVTKIGR